jgi:hypothetical protein
MPLSARGAEWVKGELPMALWIRGALREGSLEPVLHLILVGSEISKKT